MMAPNIVLIVTDDQPRGRMAAMPFVRANLRDAGVNFLNGYATTPLCGPSRTTLLTSRTSPSTGVWSNNSPDGWQGLSQYEDATLATALSGSGYYTGLFGKYMNGWSRFSKVVPPGWDDFMAISPDDGGDGAYYNYTLNGTRPAVHHGSAPEDYSTDVATNYAEQFVQEAPADKPLFLYYSPYGAHGPTTPAPRHVGTWTDPIVLNPAVNADNTDKSRWLRGLPPVDEAEMRSVIRAQHEVVKSVDEGVSRIFTALADTGREDTLFVYLGDNGLHFGEHRLRGKNLPYKPAAHLQMMARWDGHFTAVPNTGMTRVVDLSATILHAAGASLPNSEGVPVQDNSAPAGIVLAGGPGDHTEPAWVSWRNKGWCFIQYAGGGVELYDLAADRYELRNVAGLYPGRASTMRGQAQKALTSLPPDFSW